MTHAEGGIVMQRSVKTRWPAVLLALISLVVALPGPAQAQVAPAGVQSPSQQLSPDQRRTLQAIAADTWKFYGYDADIDPNTDLPRDNIGFNGPPAQGNYTSPTNIGVYMWSIVAAQDMHLINRAEAF